MFGRNQQKRLCVTVKAAALAATIATGFAMQANAQEASDAEHNNEYAHDESGGTHRIDIAGKTRALSQRVAAVSCVLGYTNDTETMRPYLSKSIDKYDKILIALRIGNPEMKIYGAEEKRRVLERLDKLEVLWKQYRAAAKSIEAGENYAVSMAFITEKNMDMLELAKELVTEVASEYTNPIDITNAEELLIDLAGRQRMLTQKIAKESCGVVSGNEALGHVEDFNKTTALYEATLHALHDGMPSVGVMSPPTEEIRVGLEKAVGHWNEISDILTRTTGKGSIDDATLIRLFDLLEEKRLQMNEITMLYEDYAETH